MSIIQYDPTTLLNAQQLLDLSEPQLKAYANTLNAVLSPPLAEISKATELISKEFNDEVVQVYEASASTRMRDLLVEVHFNFIRPVAAFSELVGGRFVRKFPEQLQNVTDYAWLKGVCEDLQTFSQST